MYNNIGITAWARIECRSDPHTGKTNYSFKMC